MNYRKIIALLLGSALLLSACSGTQTPVETQSVSEETTAAETKQETTAAVAAETTAAEAETTVAETETEAVTEEEQGKFAFVSVPEYTFTAENFPRMDGSTAAVPMGKAIVECLLGVSEEEAGSRCQFNRTTQSFRNLMEGYCDILVVGEPNASVYTEMKETGFGYELEEIATDALVFVVNESNPVDSLTTEQIRDIYSGKITNWKEVGGEDAEIVAFQRNEGAGSQALMKKLVMKDTELSEAPTEYIIDSMGELMTAVKNFDNSANAIGYSVYYYANDMKMAKGLKILKVDGVEPSDETIRSRSYPHLNAYYCVIPSKPETPDEEAEAKAESARVIYDWLATQDGQNLIASLGYVSILEPTLSESRKESVSEIITTYNGKKPGQLGGLVAGKTYGKLIPYVGDHMMQNYEGGQSYLAGYAYGFLNEKGEMVTDPVYTDITQLSYYDLERSVAPLVRLPMYSVGSKVTARQSEEYDETLGDSRYYLVSLDGSYMSEKDYALLDGSEAGVLCLDQYDSDGMEFIGFDGAVKFTDQEVREAVKGTLSDEEIKNITWSMFTYENGYYLLTTGEVQYLLDKESLAVVGGPYDMIRPLANGQFRAYVEDSSDGVYHRSALLLDKDQNVIIPAAYSDISVLENGNILACDDDAQKVDLYDAEGNLLKTIEGISNAERSVSGFRAGFSAGEGYIEATYTSDGQLIAMATSAVTEMNDASSPVYSVRGSEKDEDFFVMSEDGKILRMTQLLTGKSALLEGYQYMNALYTGYGTADLPYVVATAQDENYENEHFALIDEDLNVVYEGKGYIQAMGDPIEGTWYLLQTTPDGPSTLLDGDLNVIAENLTGDVEICGGFLLVTGDQVTEARKIGSEEICFRYFHAAAGED